MNLEGKITIPDVPPEGMDAGFAPCVFCGKIISHVNDGGEGCIAGALISGEVQHFLYCNDPICEERIKAEDAGEGVKTCSCEDYRAYDVLEDLCHVCGKPPIEPEQADWYKNHPSRPKCVWCDGTMTDEEEREAIIVVGLGESSGKYCSSDCLFHQILSDRTTEEQFNKVQSYLLEDA